MSIPAQLSPFMRIHEQISALDDALLTIQGYTDESKIVRTHIIGQIEALKWAAKLLEQE